VTRLPAGAGLRAFRLRSVRFTLRAAAGIVFGSSG
jgi:hypothetical protein